MIKQMTDDDVKTISKVVKTEIAEALVPVLKKLDEHSDKLDNHTASLVTIEATLKGYGDMYQLNKEKLEDLDERVTTLEEHQGLTPQK